MATTVLNTDNIQEFWSKRVLLQRDEESFIATFIGGKDTDIIYEITDFPGVGNTINIPLLKSLSGAGVSDDATLEASEEAMVHSTSQITPHQRRNAVSPAGKYEESKSSMRLRSQGKDLLGGWIARRQDIDWFTAQNADGATGEQATSLLQDETNWASGGTYEAWNVAVAGDATNFDNLGQGDTLNCRLISKVKRYARMRGVRPARIPLKKGSRAVYVLVVSPEQEYDLTQDERYTDLNQFAQVRGIDNPLINGATGMIDGVLIHTHENEVDGGDACTLLASMDKDTHRVMCALLLGAQSSGIAYIEQPNWYERVFDYGNRYGVATATIFGCVKTVMNRGTILIPVNRDYGSCFVLTAATKLA